MMMVPATPRESAYLPDKLSLRDLLTVVFKRWWLIAVFAAVTLVVVVLMTVLKPPTYEVAATLLVSQARAEVPIAPTESPQLIISRLSEQDLNSEIELLKSRQLLEEVVDLLGTEPPPDSLMAGLRNKLRGLMGGTQLSFRDRMVLALSEGVNVEAVRKSNVIRVSYRSQDPELATRVVGTLTERYLEKRAQRQQSPQTVIFFEEQMVAAEALLVEREDALEGFLATAGITMVRGPQGSDVVAEHKGLVMERLSRIRDELADAEVEMEESQYRVSSLRERMDAEPERLESSSRMNQDAAVEEIERALAALELERDRLLQDFKPDSRYVRDIDTQIDLARARLAELKAADGSIDGTEINPIYQELESELLRAETQLDGAQGRRHSLLAQVSILEAELVALNENAFKLERLRRDVQAAEESYLLYRKKHEEARMSAAMDEQQMINVAIAQPAQAPLKPVAPKTLLKIIAGLILGLAGGVILAFVVENYFDHTFTTGEEMERRLGLVHLASIPEEV